MAIETREFDVTEYLDSPEMIAAYLEAATEENDQAFTARAIGEVARAIGMSDIAERAGIKRETLYKAFSDKGNPTLNTMTSLFDAMGLKLVAVPKTGERQDTMAVHSVKGGSKKASALSKSLVRDRRSRRTKGKAASKAST